MHFKSLPLLTLSAALLSRVNANFYIVAESGHSTNLGACEDCLDEYSDRIGLCPVQFNQDCNCGNGKYGFTYVTDNSGELPSDGYIDTRGEGFCSTPPMEIKRKGDGPEWEIFIQNGDGAVQGVCRPTAEDSTYCDDFIASTNIWHLLYCETHICSQDQ